MALAWALMSARLFHAGRGQVLAGTAVQVSGCWKGRFRGLGRGGGWLGSGAAPARPGAAGSQLVPGPRSLARREASRPHTAGRRGNSWDSSRGAALPFPRRGHPPPVGRVRGARQRSRRLVPVTARGILPQPHHQRLSHSPPASGCSEAPRVLVLQTPQASQASCLLVSDSGRANRQRPWEGQLIAQWSPPLQRLDRTGSALCEPPHPTKAEGLEPAPGSGAPRDASFSLWKADASDVTISV